MGASSQGGQGSRLGSMLSSPIAKADVERSVAAMLRLAARHRPGVDHG